MSIALKQPKAGPRSAGTPVPVENVFFYFIAKFVFVLHYLRLSITVKHALWMYSLGLLFEYSAIRLSVVMQCRLYLHQPYTPVPHTRRTAYALSDTNRVVRRCAPMNVARISHSSHTPQEVLLARFSLCAQMWSKASFI